MTDFDPKDYINPFAEKWLRRLEKNDLPQGKYYLRSNDGFCCLGVACHISESVKFDRESFDGLSDEPCYISIYSPKDSETGALPMIVTNHLGLYSPNGGPKKGSGLISLYKLNDFCEWTFPQIASYIRKHADQYFIPIKDQWYD